MKTAKRRLQSNLGFSLVEMMIAGAMAGVLALVVSALLSSQMQSSNQNKAELARTALVNQLNFSIRKKDSILNSMTPPAPGGVAGNSILKNCVSGTDPHGCAGGSLIELNLYDYQGSGNLIAGPSVYYDLNGATCDATRVGGCPIKVTAAMMPVCPVVLDASGNVPPIGSATTCLHATSIQFAVHIAPTLQAPSWLVWAGQTISFNRTIPLDDSVAAPAGTPLTLPIWDSTGVIVESTVKQAGVGNVDVNFNSNLEVRGDVYNNVYFTPAPTPPMLTVSGNLFVNGSNGTYYTSELDVPNGVIFTQRVVALGRLVVSTHPSTTNGMLAGAFFMDSDSRLKTEISPIEDVTEKVGRLRGVSFNWKLGGHKDIGLIAQEVAEVFPELVKTSAEGNRVVEYGNLIAPLVESYKQTKAKQEQEIAEQEDEILQLQQQVSQILEKAEK